MRTRIASLKIVPEVFCLSFVVKCRDAAHRAVVHSCMAACRRRAQTKSRLAIALTFEAGAAVNRPHLDGVEHDAMLEPSQDGPGAPAIDRYG